MREKNKKSVRMSFNAIHWKKLKRHILPIGLRIRGVNTQWIQTEKINWTEQRSPSSRINAIRICKQNGMMQTHVVRSHKKIERNQWECKHIRLLMEKLDKWILPIAEVHRSVEEQSMRNRECEQLKSNNTWTKVRPTTYAKFTVAKREL